MGDAAKAPRGPSGGRTHLRIHLINGSVRSIKCTERVEMQDIVRLVVSRINAEVGVVSKHFAIRMQHERTGEAYWLAFNLSLGDVRQRYEARYPREEWRLGEDVHWGICIMALLTCLNHFRYVLNSLQGSRKRQMRDFFVEVIGTFTKEANVQDT